MTSVVWLAVLVGLQGAGQAPPVDSVQANARVYIFGLVERPGGYAFIDGLTVDQAIAKAGGVRVSAVPFRPYRIIVSRRDTAAKVTHCLATGKTLLQPSDAVEVKGSDGKDPESCERRQSPDASAP